MLTKKRLGSGLTAKAIPLCVLLALLSPSVPGVTHHAKERRKARSQFALHGVCCTPLVAWGLVRGVEASRELGVMAEDAWCWEASFEIVKLARPGWPVIRAAKAKSNQQATSNTNVDSSRCESATFDGRCTHAPIPQRPRSFLTYLLSLEAPFLPCLDRVPAAPRRASQGDSCTSESAPASVCCFDIHRRPSASRPSPPATSPRAPGPPRSCC